MHSWRGKEKGERAKRKGDEGDKWWRKGNQSREREGKDVKGMKSFGNGGDKDGEELEG